VESTTGKQGIKTAERLGLLIKEVQAFLLMRRPPPFLSFQSHLGAASQAQAARSLREGYHD
jgi:hypothetical protein